MVSEQNLKQAVTHALEGLPTEKIVEVLDFVLFLKARWLKEGTQVAAIQEPPGSILRTVPASHLDALTGLVAWGGDAVADTERLYDDHS